MKRKIILYGRLKDAGFGPSISLEIPAAASARTAMNILKATFGSRAKLLDGCALATDEAVISPAETIPPRGPLAALPPVCGG